MRMKLNVAATVIFAMEVGRKAVKGIHDYLNT